MSEQVILHVAANHRNGGFVKALAKGYRENVDGVTWGALALHSAFT